MSTSKPTKEDQHRIMNVVTDSAWEYWEKIKKEFPDWHMSTGMDMYAVQIDAFSDRDIMFHFSFYWCMNGLISDEEAARNAKVCARAAYLTVQRECGENPWCEAAR